MTSKELTKLAVAALEDRKAEDVTVIDISEISPIADYFIIANGNNANQLTAMEDAVDEAMYTNGVHQKQVEGTGNSTWILMDYQDIIVHLFSKEDRQFYDLDRIWRDGKVVDVHFTVWNNDWIHCVVLRLEAYVTVLFIESLYGSGIIYKCYDHVSV